MSRRFAWPCSQVSPELMHRLYVRSQEPGPHRKPITQLVREAIEQQYPEQANAVIEFPVVQSEPLEAA